MVPQGQCLNLYSCTFAQHFSLHKNKLLVPRGNQLLRHSWKTLSTLLLWRLHTLVNVLLILCINEDRSGCTSTCCSRHSGIHGYQTTLIFRKCVWFLTLRLSDHIWALSVLESVTDFLQMHAKHTCRKGASMSLPQLCPATHNQSLISDICGWWVLHWFAQTFLRHPKSSPLDV